MSTRKAAPKTDAAAAAADASTVDPITPAGADVAQLLDENATLRAQNDMILDGLAEMKAEMEVLKSAQTGRAATAVQQNDTEAELDAELASLTEEFADYGLIEVFERRALVGLDANTDIRLKDEPSVVVDPRGDRCKWKLRWFNFSKEGRAHQAQAEGYMKVRWDDLADQDMVTGGARSDDYVRKGDRGLEVLHKIPRKLYDYKKRRDAARQAGLLTSEAGLRDRIASSVSSMVGERGGNADQAGSFVHGKKFSMTITPGETERFTP